MTPIGSVTRIDLVGMRADDVCFQAIEVWALAAEGADGCGWVGPDGQIVPARAEDPTPACPRG
jgi:hypothetical protein